MALKELQREQASVKILTMQNNEVSEQWGLSTWTHVTYVGGEGGRRKRNRRVRIGI